MTALTYVRCYLRAIRRYYGGTTEVLPRGEGGAGYPQGDRPTEEAGSRQQFKTPHTD